MKNIMLCAVALAVATIIQAQHTFRALIKHDNEPLAGASVVLSPLNLSAVADSTGAVVITSVPPGKYKITVTHVGYSVFSRHVDIPMNGTELQIELEHEEEEEEEVIIQSTRTSRTIQNIPTRVETIIGEEIDEKSNMRPSNVTMLLNESTGIRIQQTSATSANAGIRIQGLDGRYTQILKDGLPNFSGFSGGLSVLEIPPLDLRQVEVIKGPASTLYGGGAIAGVVNFISIEPGEENYSRFLVNHSHIGQTNIGMFTTQRFSNVGITMLATANRQRAYDVDEDGFTEVPKTKDYTISPKLFFYPGENSEIIIGHTFTTGDRRGGDINVVNGKPDALHTYFENNYTTRNNSTIEFRRNIGDNRRLIAKQSLGFFNRQIALPGYGFKGLQTFAYTDISYLKRSAKHILITGVNFTFDDFNEDAEYSGVKRNDQNITGGVYLQDTWDATGRLAFENGLRIDVTDRFGIHILPRLSVLYRFSDALSTRIGAGIGYKLPTMFTEETEAIHFQNVATPGNGLDAERSYGATADLNFRKKAGELEISVNHMFFYTLIRSPLILQGDPSGYFFVNADRSTRTYGFETNLKFIYKHNWKLFAGYTFNETDARWKTGNTFLPLVPRGKLNTALIYEKHDFLKVGFEAYHTERQLLSDGTTTPDFWILGFMVEKPWKNFSFFINFENFTDERQSNYKPVVNGPHDNPTFDEIWNHTEGRVINGGVKLRF